MNVKSKNKYNKRLKYMQHHQLRKINYPTGFITAIAMGVAIIARIFKKTCPSFLLSFNATIIILSLIYALVIRPAIYKGKIIAYYRRNYSPRLQRFVNYYKLLINFAVVNIVFCIIYTVFFIRAITSDYIPVPIDDIVRFLQGNKFLYILKQSYNLKGIIVASIISFLLLYYLFFEDEYITIADYSNGIVYRMKELGMYFESAVSDLMKTKDKEHNVKAYGGIYYDFKDKKSKDVSIKEEKPEKKEEEPVRRRARKNKEDA